LNNNNDFIIRPKEDKTITMTIRVDKSVQEQFDELAKQSNRSRNELISMALEYALLNVKFVSDVNKDKY
jgi:predicted transcriptional regulator